MGTVSEDRADGLECCHSVGFLLFEAADLTFRVSGVDYMAFLKNFPFLKRLRVWLTGIRSVSLFFDKNQIICLISFLVVIYL